MKRSVLLVEDDFFIRDLYQRALESSGYEVITASTGEEAITAFENADPSLILLDIMLPETSGMAVLKYVREQASRNNRIPIVMVSNLNTAEAKQQATELGANAYLEKAKFGPLDVATQVVRYIDSDDSDNHSTNQSPEVS